MKNLNLKLQGIGEPLSREQMKSVFGGKDKFPPPPNCTGSCPGSCTCHCVTYTVDPNEPAITDCM